MRKVIANKWTTLSETVQAPSYADEDVTDGRAVGPAENLSVVRADHCPLLGVSSGHRGCSSPDV